jgi:hypothetical protein
MSKTSHVSELSEKLEKYIPISSKYFTYQTTLVSINLIKHKTTKDDALAYARATVLVIKKINKKINMYISLI